MYKRQLFNREQTKYNSNLGSKPTVTDKPSEKPSKSKAPKSKVGYTYKTTDKGQIKIPTVTAPGGTASMGGGMTGSDTRPDDPRGEGQYGSYAAGQANSGSSSTPPPAVDTGGGPRAEGGLMLKKKKKKTKGK